MNRAHSRDKVVLDLVSAPHTSLPFVRVAVASCSEAAICALCQQVNANVADDTTISISLNEGSETKKVTDLVPEANVEQLRHDMHYPRS